VQAGGTLDGLRALAKAAPPWTPAPDGAAGEGSPERADAGQPAAAPAEAKQADGPMMVCMADVRRVVLRWLWPGRIPLGKLAMITGDPKLGKSVLSLSIAAAVSRGLPWPDGADAPEPGGVVLLSAEDDPADTIRPRLDAAGADVSRVHLLAAVRRQGKERHPSLADDLPAIVAAVAAVPGCRLLIVDPITAYMGGTDSHVNAEVRGMLAPLAKIAADAGIAVVLIAHMNKASGGKALYRVNGSLAFVAAARATHVCVEDAAEKGRVLFLPSGGNLGPDAKGLAYRVVGSPEDATVPVLAWEPEPVDVTAGEALAREADGADAGERGATADAEVFLRDALAGGPRKAGDVQRDARTAGLAVRTLARARERLGVRPVKMGGGPWLWALPAEDGVRCQAPTVGILAPCPAEAQGRGLPKEAKMPSAEVLAPCPLAAGWRCPTCRGDVSWFEGDAHRCLACDPPPKPTGPATPSDALSDEEFEAAEREAIRAEGEV